MSQNNSVQDEAGSETAEDSWFESRQGRKICLLSYHPDKAWSPPSLLHKWYRGLSHGGKGAAT